MSDNALLRVGLLPSLQRRLEQDEAFRPLEQVWQELAVRICSDRLGANLALCLLEDYTKFAASQASAFAAWLSTVEHGGLLEKWAASPGFPDRFFETYPVARAAYKQIATAAIGFATRVQQSMRRHRALIVADFGPAFDPDHIINAEPTAGDFHNGQCTIRLRYGNGSEAYWKPRAALPETAFYALWNELQRQLRWYTEPAPPIVHLGDAHLAGHIARQACAHRALYWRKSGALLALAALLGVRDLHHENVVAASTCPMPVDLEVMLTGFAPGRDRATFSPFDVYRTGLLPCQNDEAEFPEIGGLFSAAALSFTRFVTLSRRGRIGADTVVAPRNPAECNIPIGADGSCTAQDIENLVCGYTDAVIALDNASASIFNAESLANLEKVAPRTIVIGTQGYYRILRGASQPHAMKEMRAHEAYLAANFDEELQRRGRRLSKTTRTSTLLALASWDVPLHRAQSFAGCSPLGGLEPVLLQRLGDMQQSVARQQHLIRMCTYVRMVNPREEPPPPSYASLEAAIEDTYAALQKLIFQESRGSAIVGLREKKSINANPCLLVDELGPGFYAGRSGVAIALAAYGRVKGCEVATQRALSLLDACVRDYENLPEKDFLVPALYGIDEGIAGLVYALSVARRLVPAHAHRILRMFERVWPRAVLLTGDGHGNFDSKDVLTGSSGMILALLAAGQAFGEAPLLLASRLAHELGDPPPTMGSGLLHGASGVALALLRVFRATGDERLLRAANAHITQDDRSIQRAGHVGSTRPDISWCHGNLGNLTAKVLYARLTPDGAYARTVEETLSTMRKQARAFSNAAVCCGSFGLVLFEQTFDDDPRVDPGRSASMKRGLEADWRATGGTIPLGYSAGLFTGTSGVLYGMLRSVDRTLPNFAAFE